MKDIFNSLDYTTKARDVAFRHPIMNAIGTQVNFWVVAFLLFSVTLYFFSNSISDSIPFAKDPLPFFISSFFLSLCFGILTGIAEHFIFSRKLTHQSTGFLILAKAGLYTVLMTLLFAVLRFVFWDYLIQTRYTDNAEFLLSDKATFYGYLTILAYTLTMGLVISFIVQINSKFGPGVLIPIIMGKYLKPIEEERIFIFLDLKSSTSIAEKIGHIKYSQLIRDCFIEINEVSRKFRAEIYQYVGDEVVLTWKVNSLREKLDVVDFFYAVKFALEKKQSYYHEKYGVQPEFKAGAHIGIITAVEVGSIKREVAYHGDTINVAARIQGKCEEFGSELLISKELADQIKWDDRFIPSPIVSIILKGRQKPITLNDVKWYLTK